MVLGASGSEETGLEEAASPVDSEAPGPVAAAAAAQPPSDNGDARGSGDSAGRVRTRNPTIILASEVSSWKTVIPLLIWFAFVYFYAPVRGVCNRCSSPASVLCGKCGRMCAKCANEGHVKGESPTHERYCWIDGRRTRIQHGYEFVDGGACNLF